MNSATPQPFLARHDFLIRRLHSLTGLIPVGAYMAIHLTANASVLDSPAAYQRAVYQIHSLGAVLPLVEWLFILLPILFHGVIGVLITAGGLPNVGAYPYSGNVRYTLQRVTGLIAFAFILWHVFHMHGWFHFRGWLENVAGPLGGHQFRPFNAASSLGAAMSGVAVPAVYAVGVASCVYHLANGLWTMGITWGLWTSAAAQARATRVCLLLGLLLGALGLAAWIGAVTVDVPRAMEVENKMYEAKVSAGELDPERAEHKRADAELQRRWRAAE